MTSEITVITTPFFLKVSVNCYLVRDHDGFFLIDTGRSNKRWEIEKEMARASCRQGDLKLILLTHGDFDHCGNAAYFREKFGAKSAMHNDDSGMVEYGDMTWNRKKQNILIRTILGLMVRLSEADRFKPDIFLEDGDDLSEKGLEAIVIHIPGHSLGSVAFLTAGGELFCGDLLANTDKPDIWSIIDDPAAAAASIDKLKEFEIGGVYPGHGDTFTMVQFRQNYSPSP
jgi:hydroxyacylglutathione hydrolase